MSSVFVHFVKISGKTADNFWLHGVYNPFGQFPMFTGLPRVKHHVKDLGYGFFFLCF